MKKALFAGTFDPPTLGHLNIIKRANALCDRLYVGIGENPKKNHPLFSLEERMEMLTKITAHLPYVEVVSFSTLVTEFAKEHQIDFLLRGLRGVSDLNWELQMAFANRKLSGIETLYLMADENVAHISSTLIREIGSYGVRLHHFIPDEIEPQVFKSLNR